MAQSQSELSKNDAKESIPLCEEDLELSTKPILAVGPLIQVIDKNEDLLNNDCKRGHYGSNDPVTDFSDLQVITTKEEYDKLANKLNSEIKVKELDDKQLLNNNTSNTVPRHADHSTQNNLQFDDSSISKPKLSSVELVGLTVQKDTKSMPIMTHTDISIQGGKMKESGIPFTEKLDDGISNSNTFNRLTKRKSIKESKIGKINLAVKSKSKDSVFPSIKNKFNPESLLFINQAMKGAIFSGWVGEREYVDKIKDYRDIIDVDEWEETLNQKLKTIVNNISGVKEQAKWINITAPDGSPCYRLWVALDSAPFPGHYWFHIEDVIVENKFGLRVIVKIIRPIHTFDGESSLDREKRIKGDVHISAEEWKTWLLTISDLKYQDILGNVLAILTPSNINSLFRLIVVLCVTLVVAFAKFLQESWNFLLKFLREFGIFVHHATPFLQSVLNFIEKLIGGFYLLLAMLYRDIRRPPPPPLHMPFDTHHLPIGPPGNYSKFSMPKEPTQSVKYVPPQSWVYRNEKA